MARGYAAQATVEYMVILAIIMVIALVAIGLSLFYTQTSGDIVQSEIDAYWSTQVRPLRIADMQGYYFSGTPTSGELAFVMQNVGTYPMYLRNFVIEPYPVSAGTFTLYGNHSTDGSNAIYNLGSGGPTVAYANQFNITIQPGEKRSLYLRMPYVCDTNTQYVGGGQNTRFYKNLTIYYDTPYFKQLSFKGLKPVSGRCNPI